jgi:hypothetical protein
MDGLIEVTGGSRAEFRRLQILADDFNGGILPRVWTERPYELPAADCAPIDAETFDKLGQPYLLVRGALPMR